MEARCALLLLQHLLYLSSLAHPDASKIHVQNLGPVTDRNFWRWYRWASNTGIVNSDVYTSECVHGLPDPFLNRFLAADIHFDRPDVDIGISSPQLIQCCLQSLRIDISDCQSFDAVCGKAVCSILANTCTEISDTAARSRDWTRDTIKGLPSWHSPEAAPVTNAVPLSRAAIMPWSPDAVRKPVREDENALYPCHVDQVGASLISIYTSCLFCLFSREGLAGSHWVCACIFVRTLNRKAPSVVICTS
jgi:hypothetical protein